MPPVDNYFDKLHKVWTAINNTRLVITGDVSSISTFEQVLNKAVASTPQEITIGNTVRVLSRINRDEFTKYIQNTEQEFLVLLADGMSIARALGIDKITKISWNKYDNIFNVNQVLIEPSLVPKLVPKKKVRHPDPKAKYNRNKSKPKLSSNSYQELLDSISNKNTYEELSDDFILAEKELTEIKSTNWADLSDDLILKR